MNEEDNARWDEREMKKKTKKKKENEEEQNKYSKTKLSVLRRSVFEPTVQDMPKLRKENFQKQQKWWYSRRRVNRKTDGIHVDIHRILKNKGFSRDIHQQQ